MIEAWGRLVGRRPWTVLLASVLIIAAASAYGFGVFGALSNGGFFVPVPVLVLVPVDEVVAVVVGVAVLFAALLAVAAASLGYPLSRAALGL